MEKSSTSHWMRQAGENVSTPKALRSQSPGRDCLYAEGVVFSKPRVVRLGELPWVNPPRESTPKALHQTSSSITEQWSDSETTRSTN